MSVKDTDGIFRRTLGRLNEDGRRGVRRRSTLSEPDRLPVNGLTNLDRETLEASAGWTMCSPLQRQFMLDATRYVEANGIQGAIVECGVWRGGMMQIAARTLLSQPGPVSDSSHRHLWLYDTFEGMPTPAHELDRDLYRGEHASLKMKREPKSGPNGAPTIWCLADLADVSAGMASTKYPAEYVHYVEGPVEQTIPSNACGPIALLRVDTDWYSSTRHILEHFFDHVVPGGVVAFDDYDSWEGARTAIDDFFLSRGLKPLLVRLDKGRIFTKSAHD